MRRVIDIEGNDLLNERTIDYNASPYRATPYFKIWCLYERDIDNPDQVIAYIGEDEVERFLDERLPHITELVAHNGIDYDFLALKLKYPGKFEYEIDEFNSYNCTINGRKVRIVDTLVLSKTLNPDRYGGHSLEEWGVRTGFPKTDWRKEAIELGLTSHHAPKGAEFQKWHPRMGEYCGQDTLVNVHTYLKLMEEWGSWAWEGPFSLEQATREVITRQSHRGFWFNSELAVENVRELDAKMEEIRQIVEPLIPPKPMGKGKLKEYCPPKIQFKKNGEVSAVMLKWVAKHDGAFENDEEGKPIAVGLYGKRWTLPMSTEVPVKTHEPATVKDTTHIKGWLVELGWKPTQYKERDLTVDTKKQKISEEKYREVVERYVEQTLNSPFCEDRCDEIGVHKNALLQKLLRHDHLKRPMKVLTNPSITVGQEKEIDPALEKLHDKFPHAKLVSEYLTYAHRRNSILGGGFDPDDLDDEDDEWAGKGFMAAGRISVDGRIPTPADSCGAGTSRFKHRLVANIPRITSLYGAKMRALFGTDLEQGFYQMGYDFASLEAMIESHYCWKYDTEEGKPYCVSLTREKPHDVHTITAAKISALIGQEFKRTPAKSVKYCCSYGGQPKRVAKTVGCSEQLGAEIHAAFWEAAKPLALLGEKLKEYWQTTGGKKFILGIDGRKIPTRSASALINSLFQSAGVICAKRAMVIHDRKMRAEGLTVDFWREDWKNKAFVQQLIAYHDEAQLEVHKSLIKWKVFKTEEEAKNFKLENPGWSEIGHSDKGHYIGWCRAGELIQEAVRETSKFYKLNVTLAADYILGRNWGECH
jgi:hypothetical protein